MSFEVVGLLHYLALHPRACSYLHVDILSITGRRVVFTEHPLRPIERLSQPLYKPQQCTVGSQNQLDNKPGTHQQQGEGLTQVLSRRQAESLMLHVVGIYEFKNLNPQELEALSSLPPVELYVSDTSTILGVRFL